MRGLKIIADPGVVNANKSTMRASDEDWDASEAANMMFVVEATIDGCHRASFILEQSWLQYYDIPNARVNPHFQITQRQLKSYTESLKSRGFRQETLQSGKPGQDLPSGFFYAIIQRDNNYFYDEITVVNCIADFRTLGPWRSTSKWLTCILSDAMLGSTTCGSNNTQVRNVNKNDLAKP